MVSIYKTIFDEPLTVADLVGVPSGNGHPLSSQLPPFYLKHSGSGQPFNTSRAHLFAIWTPLINFWICPWLTIKIFQGLKTFCSYFSAISKFVPFTSRGNKINQVHWDVSSWVKKILLVLLWLWYFYIFFPFEHTPCLTGSQSSVLKHKFLSFVIN